MLTDKTTGFATMAQPSVAARALGIPELREMVLAHLPARDLLIVLRVAKAFRESITNATDFNPFQERLGLRLIHGTGTEDAALQHGEANPLFWQDRLLIDFRLGPALLPRSKGTFGESHKGQTFVNQFNFVHQEEQHDEIMIKLELPGDV